MRQRHPHATAPSVTTGQQEAIHAGQATTMPREINQFTSFRFSCREAVPVWQRRKSAETSSQACASEFVDSSFPTSSDNDGLLCISTTAYYAPFILLWILFQVSSRVFEISARISSSASKKMSSSSCIQMGDTIPLDTRSDTMKMHLPIR